MDNWFDFIFDLSIFANIFGVGRQRRVKGNCRWCGDKYDREQNGIDEDFCSNNCCRMFCEERDGDYSNDDGDNRDENEDDRYNDYSNASEDFTNDDQL